MFLARNSRNSRAARWLRNKWFSAACAECGVPAWKLAKYSSTEFKRHFGSALADE
jgi:pyrrolysyl-tRNA synthetase-like protein